MDPAILALLASSIYKGVKGAQQTQEGKRLESSYDRPILETPQAQVQSLNILAQQAQQSELAGYEKIQQNLDRQTAGELYNITQSARNPAQAVQNIGRIGARRAGIERDLSIEGSRQQRMSQNRLARGLKDQAAFELQQFQINKYQPYQQAQQAAGALQGAGTQNIYGGLDQLGELLFLGQGNRTGTTTPTTDSGQSLTPGATIATPDPFLGIDKTVSQRKGL